MSLIDYLVSIGYVTENFKTNISYGFLFYTPDKKLVGEVHLNTGTYSLYLPVSKEITRALEENKKQIKGK